ncbi:hypothetical protein [Priestia sp. LL-8]|uniref:hypothetical protein n=1 Tax=Priestia sp. LL-8 TaxID=3110068 RepID=UPI002E26FB25|nr:hypothetical protein [Priestia sp. LL-8]
MAPEDLHAYNIDELLIDATASLHLFAKTPEEIWIIIRRTTEDDTIQEVNGIQVAIENTVLSTT